MENQSDILIFWASLSCIVRLPQRGKKKGNKKNQVLLSDSLITNQRSHRAKLATLLRFSCFHRDSESMVFFPIHISFSAVLRTFWAANTDLKRKSRAALEWECPCLSPLLKEPIRQAGTLPSTLQEEWPPTACKYMSSGLNKSHQHLDF